MGIRDQNNYEDIMEKMDVILKIFIYVIDSKNEFMYVNM